MDLYTAQLRQILNDPGAEPELFSSDSGARVVENLLSCLRAGKDFLDKILATESSEYASLSLVEWILLPHVILILAKLSCPNPKYAAASWDVQMAQETLRLDLRLESLHYRTQSLVPSETVALGYPNFFSSFKKVIEDTISWYKLRSNAEIGDLTNFNGTENSPLKNMFAPAEIEQPNNMVPNTDENEFPFMDLYLSEAIFLDYGLMEDASFEF
jgi:hypothetical protein